MTGLFQFVYTLILKKSSQGGVPDGADRSEITWYVDMFEKEPKCVLGKCQTTRTNPKSPKKRPNPRKPDNKSDLFRIYIPAIGLRRAGE